MPMLFAFEALAPEMFATEAFGAEALGSALGAEALMGLGAEALGAGAVGGAEAALGAEAMAADAAAGGAGAGGAGINAAQVAAQQSAAQGINAIPQAMSPAQQAYQAASSASATPGITPGTTPLPAYNNAFPTFNGPVTSPISGIESAPGFEGAIAGPQGASPGFFNPTQAPGQGPMQYQLSAPNASQGLRLGTGLESISPSAPITSVLQPPSALEAGMDKAIKFAEKYPFPAMAGAYMGASALGLLNPSGATFNDKPYDGPLSRYHLSPNFQGRTANPADFQYDPATNRRYAGGGGIMGVDPYAIPVGYAEGDLIAPPKLAANDPANIPMGNNRLSPVDQYKAIAYDTAIMDGTAPIMPRDRAATIANLNADSNVGRFAVPGYGDLGQFAGSFDPANVPMGNNRLSPADQYKLIKQDAGLLSGDVTLNNYRGPLPFGTTEALNNNSVSPQVLKDLQNAAAANLGGDSDVGRFAVPGYGDQGQFFSSSNPLKDDNPYNVDAFASGGSLSDSIASYQKMLGGQPQAAPAASRDVGIYYDQDPDTRYQDALTAAQIRQAKVNQRAYVSAPVAKRPTPMGQLQMASVKPRKQSDSSGDVEARHGGIMHSSLGNYAAGGNPRLLKGPGDGMSDNIPATINGRQPARLADGEFVIPADVVSHLGNGSTEAGAKQLHAMMNNIRKARTGNPKQGKQINAEKYMPK